MTLFTLALALTVYLLVGCILMLIANELFEGSITRSEFVKGMLVWPRLAACFIEILLSDLFTRIFSRG